jgi:hypothetical protein
MWMYEHVKMCGAIVNCSEVQAQAIATRLDAPLYGPKELPMTLSGGQRHFIPFARDVDQKYGSARLGLFPHTLPIFDVPCEWTPPDDEVEDQFWKLARGIEATIQSIEAGVLHTADE